MGRTLREVGNAGIGDIMFKIEEVSDLPMLCSICNTNQTFVLVSSETKMEKGVMISKSVMKLACGHTLEFNARCWRPEDPIIKP